MATRNDRTGNIGIWIGGILVVAGVATMIFGSFWIGLVATLVGLAVFGGFAGGRWYREPRTPA